MSLCHAMGISSVRESLRHSWTFSVTCTYTLSSRKRRMRPVAKWGWRESEGGGVEPPRILSTIITWTTQLLLSSCYFFLPQKNTTDYS